MLVLSYAASRSPVRAGDKEPAFWIGYAGNRPTAAIFFLTLVICTSLALRAFQLSRRVIKQLPE